MLSPRTARLQDLPSICPLTVRRIQAGGGSSRFDDSSVAELLESGVKRSNGLVGGSLSASLLLGDLGGVVGSGLGLSLLLELVDDVSLGPAGQGSEFTERAVRSTGLEAESFESVRDDHALLLVVGEGAALEDLQLAESGGTSGELVGEHATDDLPEDARWGPPVLGSTTWVRVNPLLHNVLSNDLVSLEGAGLEDLLAAHNSDTLARQKLLGDNAGEATLKVASSVNDQLLFEHA